MRCRDALLIPRFSTMAVFSSSNAQFTADGDLVLEMSVPWMFPAGTVPSHAGSTSTNFTAI